jgi:mono/diheme cytochrome c family protein
MIMNYVRIMKLFIILLFTVFCITNAFALPFNDDMVDSQLKAGQVMREAPSGVVPHGQANDIYDTKESAEKAVNTVKATKFSIKSGHRLYRANCYPCHGWPSKDNYQPGPVGHLLPGPNLALDMFAPVKGGAPAGLGRTDASIFTTVRFGNIIMPAVGWKLDSNEIWDIVNYLRDVQASK